MNKKTGRIWPWYLLAAALVGADQLVKALVRSNLAVGEQRPFIPYVLELFHVENTGAAFSILSGHTWALTLVSVLASLALVAALSWWCRTRGAWFRASVALMLAGAVGNLIDRAAFGKVTDMFNFTFMRFGVFNVADMCVVVGVFSFLICLFVQNGKEGNEDDGGDAPADRQP